MNWLWSSVVQTAQRQRKGVATPVVGGVVTSALLELLVYPVIFLIWKRRALNESS